MSPVQESRARSPRSLVLAVAGVVLGIALILGLFVVAIPSLTEDGKVEVKLGSDTYDAGPADARAANIAADGPILFSDVSSGQRDIFLQHLGDDPATGWYAFDSRRPGQDRTCTLQWRSASEDFLDPCDDSVVPADGTGLIAYAVIVTDDDRVVVDLKGDDTTSTTSGG